MTRAGPDFYRRVAAVVSRVSRRSAATVEAVGRPYDAAALDRWAAAGLLPQAAVGLLRGLAARAAVSDADLEAAVVGAYGRPDTGGHGPRTGGRGPLESGGWSWGDIPGRSRSRRSGTLPPLPPDPDSGGHGVLTPDLSAEMSGWSWGEGTGEFTPAEMSITEESEARFMPQRLVAEDALFLVYEALDRRLERPVRLSVHRPEGPRHAAACLAAINLQATLQHPAIEPVYAVGQLPDDRPFYATGALSPRTLADALSLARVERRPTLSGPLLEALQDVAWAVTAAHSQGVAHRDVQPERVVLGPLGEVKLTCWARARLQGQPMESALEVALTPSERGRGYLAPERLLRGLGACGEPADVWGLGAILYHFITGGPPLTGALDGPDAIAEAMARGVQPIPRGVAHSALVRLCQAALKVDPSARRLTALEFTLRLRAWMEGPDGEASRLTRAQDRLGAAEAAEEEYELALVRLGPVAAQEARLRRLAEAEDRQAGAAAREALARRVAEADRAWLRADELYAEALDAWPRFDDARLRRGRLAWKAREALRLGRSALEDEALEALIEAAGPPLTTADSEPSQLEIRTRPSGLTAWLHQVVLVDDHYEVRAGRRVGSTPRRIHGLPAGSWRLRVQGHRGEVNASVMTRPGARTRVEISPEVAPAGCVLVPEGAVDVGLGGEAGLVQDALPPARCHVGPFFLATSPVTCGAWAEFLNNMARDEPEAATRFAPRASPGGPPLWRPEGGQYRLPWFDDRGAEWTAECLMAGITPQAAEAYIGWLRARDGLPWRLPREVEWEKAARGADARRFPWGNAPRADIACDHRGRRPPVARAHPVDTSIYGVSDLAGGVREYTADTMTGGQTVLRGGAWCLPPEEATATVRTPIDAAELRSCGLRLALDAGPGGPPPGPPLLLDIPPGQAPELPDPVPVEFDPTPEPGEPAPPTEQAEETLPPDAEESEATTTVGAPPERYVILEEIARGSMGRVVLAFDRALARRVALKVLHRHHETNVTVIQRFVREARVTGRLEANAILPVHDQGRLPDGSRFFAMGPVSGQSLSSILKAMSRGDARARGAWPRDRRLTLFRRVCAAVACAHNQGVVHRDIKPANVLVGQQGAAYLVDFGLARLMDSADSHMSSGSPNRITRSGTVIGTPHYMSPEQAMGLTAMVGPRTDIYGLGALLYHLLALRPPFLGSDVHEVLEKVRAGHPPPPSAVAPDEQIPPALDPLCLEAMAMNPEHRPDGPMALAEAVARVQHRARLGPETGDSPVQPPESPRTSTLEVATDLPGARVSLVPADEEAHRAGRAITRPLGPAPARLNELREGQWLAILEAPTGQIRVPFEAHKGQTVRLEILGPPGGLVPHGYAWIPPGPARVGDPAASRVINGVLVALMPVSHQQYARYVAEAPGARPARTPDGRVLEALPGASVTGVSLEDARQWCAWFARHGAPPGYRPRLLTAEEWEKAARGTDGRPLPWGARFEPEWVHRGGRAALEMVEPPRRDTSPWGIRGLASGVMEWTTTQARQQGHRGAVRVYGGLGLGGRHRRSIAGYIPATPQRPDPLIGFRIALEPL